MSPSSISETHYDLVRDALFDNDRDRVIELLALPGVDVNHLDAGGQTLLHLASFWGRMDLTKLLLAAGASLTIENAAGCTALDLATHWGHSAVAEVIRLRGGPSVWEEKLCALQTELEDGKLRFQDLEAQNHDKRCQLEAMELELEGVQIKLAEEKSAHLLATASYQRTCQHLASQLEVNQQLEQERVSLAERVKESIVAQLNSERASARAREELIALKAHRDDVLVRMQASVRQQEDVADKWQRAEMAAAIADTQRNVALAERDRIVRAHGATLAELLVTTERLGAAEDELMKLKTDLAEHIFDLKRAQRSKKHALHALTPASRTKMKLVDKKRATGSKTREVKDVDQLLDEARVIKSTLSLAAREFGDRVRTEEQQKLRHRSQRLHKVEDGYRAHGSQAEVFRRDLITAEQALALSQRETWQQLKSKRDDQARFAAVTLARPMSTVSLPLTSSSESLEGTLPIGLFQTHALSLPQLATASPVTSWTERNTHADSLATQKTEDIAFLPIL